MQNILVVQRYKTIQLYVLKQGYNLFIIQYILSANI